MAVNMSFHHILQGRLRLAVLLLVLLTVGYIRLSDQIERKSHDVFGFAIPRLSFALDKPDPQFNFQPTFSNNSSNSFTNDIFHPSKFFHDKKLINSYLSYGPSPSTIGLDFTYPSRIRDPHPFLKNYVHWHAVQMKCIQNNLCYSKRKRKMKIMMWKCEKEEGCRGIGDRFRGMIYTLTLAMVTEHVFLLQWPLKPFPFLHAVSPSAIDWRPPPHLLKDTKNWAVARTYGAGIVTWLKCPENFTCIHHNIYTQQPKSRNKTTLPTTMLWERNDSYQLLSQPGLGNIQISSMEALSEKMYARDEWARYSNNTNAVIDRSYIFYMDRNILRCLIRPSPVTKHILRHFIHPEALQNGYITVHARTGLESAESSSQRFSPMRAVNTTIIAKRFMACVEAQRGDYITFVSDSRPLKSTFVKLATEKGFNVMFSTLGATHVGLGQNYNNYSNNVMEMITDERWQSFLNVFVEFFAIANSTKIICNKSEFSRLGHMLSDAPIDCIRMFNSTLDSYSCPHITNDTS